MAKIYKHISKPEHSVPARELLKLGQENVSEPVLRQLLISGPLTKKMNTVIGSLIAEEGLWDMAMELSGDGDDRIAFRASWGLEWAYTLDSSKIEERFPEFFRCFLNSGNGSVQRVYSKMICDMTRREAITLSDEESLLLAEKCFDLLVAPGTAIAVRAWQVELLYDLIPRIDWIEENLTGIILNMSGDPENSPAIAAVARHYFARLKKRKHKNTRTGA